MTGHGIQNRHRHGTAFLVYWRTKAAALVQQELAQVKITKTGKLAPRSRGSQATIDTQQAVIEMLDREIRRREEEDDRNRARNGADRNVAS